MIDSKKAREQTDIANSTRGQLAILSRLIQEASRDGKCYIEVNHNLTPETIKELQINGYDLQGSLNTIKGYKIEW